MLLGRPRPLILDRWARQRARTPCGPAYQGVAGQPAKGTRRLDEGQRGPWHPPALISSDGNPVMWTAVESLWTTLLACPVAVHVRGDSIVPDQGGHREQLTRCSFVEAGGAAPTPPFSPPRPGRGRAGRGASPPCKQAVGKPWAKRRAPGG